MVENEIRSKMAEALDTALAPFYEFYCGGTEAGKPEMMEVDSASCESNMARVTKWEDFSTIVFPFVAVLGPEIAVNAGLASKLVRLCSVFFKDDEWRFRANFHDIQQTMMQMVERSLVPAVSLMEPSVGEKYVSDVWELLKNYPFEERYKVYHVWGSELADECQELRDQRGRMLDELRKLMKRLSKDTVSQIGDKVAILVNVYPQPAIDYILEKVQESESFIIPTVEIAKQFNDLSLDIFTFCLLRCLAEKGEAEKVTDAGMSPGMQTLASLVAQVYTRYPLDPTSLLQYIANQMKDWRSLDLMFLRELILAVSGLEAEKHLTTEDLDVECGGECLQREAGYSSSNKLNHRAARRLRDSLINSKQCLFECLCILIPQQKSFILHRDALKFPPKLVTHLIDQCQETFVQYQKFVLYNVKSEAYAKRVPSVEILLRYFHVDIQSAMCLNRPIYVKRMKEIYRSSLKSLEPANDGSDPELQREKKVALFKDAFNRVIEDLQRELIDAYPNEYWNDVTSRLYAIFWLLSAADLHVPLKAYEKHIKTHGAHSNTDDTKKGEEEGESSRRRHARVEATDVASKLRSEMKAQIEHVDLIREALAAEKSLFAETQSRMVRFLHRCILPRSMVSEADAIYCVKFIELLHQTRTPFFQTIVLYDKVFCDVEPMLASMTEAEVNCYGTFLCKSLEMLMRWRSQEDFDTECLGFPGCTTRVRDPITGLANDFSHEHYLKLVSKFHTRLAVVLGSILASDSSKFTLLRNTLIVMSKIIPHFPFHTPNYQTIEKRVKELMSRVGKTMPDLNLLAKSYFGKLRQRLAAEVKKRDGQKMS